MQVLRFHYRPLRYLVTRRLPLPPLVRLDDVPPPTLPSPVWVRIRTSLSGICGSDLSALTAHDSLMLEPFGAFPFTFGHENVGVVVETGRAVTRWRVGDRVVVNPMLACRQRALEPPCPACARGDYGLCRRTAEGVPGPGPLIGYSPRTGGGWSECFVAHETQLHPAGALDDDVAVLTDPFASALRGVLLHPPASGDVVLVIGAGTIGLLAVRALRACGWEGEIAVLARYPAQQELAAAAGASTVLRRRADLYGWAAALPGAGAYRPRLAPRFVEGGPSLVYDTVGSQSSLDDALALTREAGRLVLVGAAAKVRLDLTRVWYRQLVVAGIYAYGRVPFRGTSRDIYEAALTLLHEGALEGLPLVTARYPIERYRQAIATALDKRGGAIKVVFRPVQP